MLISAQQSAELALTQGEELRLNYTLIQAMSTGEIMDRVFDAWERWKRKSARHRAAERREYNWWVDVYNFRHGKLILQNK